MYITLITIAILLIAIILIIINSKTDSIDLDLMFGTLIVGIVGIVICLIMIIYAHVTAHTTLHANIEIRNSLIKRCELVNSDYEDVSKSDLIKDIADFNADLYSYKYWQASPWTNWFYSKEVADTLDYVEYPN